MYKGTVTFRAQIKGNRLTFPLCEVTLKEAGVDKVELESKGDEILSTVYLASVASADDGAAIATKVNTAALNRISYRYDMVIEHGEIIDSGFVLLDPPPGRYVIVPGTGRLTLTGGDVTFARGVTTATIKALLEQESPPGEEKFGLYRSARQSRSPVEEFVHLYNLLLMIFSDKQDDVDAFIVGQEPTVIQTQSPVKKPGVMETLYTRLRNELAHSRKGVNIDGTKIEMAKHLGDLIALTKRAIEQGS